MNRFTKSVSHYIRCFRRTNTFKIDCNNSKYQNYIIIRKRIKIYLHESRHTLLGVGVPDEMHVVTACMLTRGTPTPLLFGTV